MGDVLRFWARFLRDPVRTGAVAPSSRYLAHAMVASVDWADVRTVVELGPGTGVFTAEIHGRLEPKARFLAVELDAEFAERLRARFPELTVIEGSAENLVGHLRQEKIQTVDCILSGLPWAAFTIQHQLRLLASVAEALPTGGVFATFAYIHGRALPAGRRFRRLLEETFSELEVSPVVWRNLPPAWVYRCRK